LNRWRKIVLSWPIRRFRVKLAIFLSMPVVVVSLFIFLYFPRQLKRQAVRMASAKAEAIADLMAYSIGPSVFFNDTRALNETLGSTVRNNALLYVFVCDTTGRLVSGAGLLPEGIGPVRSGEDPAGGAYRTGRMLTHRGRTVGRLYLGISVRELEAQVANSRRATALVSLLVCLSGILASVGLSRVITRPLIQIAGTADAIAAGDLSQRARVRSRDEVGRLAESFNAMVNRLQNAHGALEALNRDLERRVSERTDKMKSEIAEREKTEAALKETYSRLQALMKAIPDIIHFKDQENRIRIVNRAFERLVGRESAEILGKTDAEVLPGNIVDFNRKSDAETLRRRKVTRHTERVTGRNGKTIVLETIKAPMFDADGNPLGLVAVGRDITEQVRLDEEKKRIETQLMQAQKMEAVGILAGGIAHDFNNLLTAIIGTAEMALRQMNSSHPLHAGLTDIHTAGERAADLTRQLLYFSRKQHMQYASLRLNELIENLYSMFHRIIGEDIEIRTELEPGCRPIRGDRGTMEQVIMNLVVNARDAMPRGGRLMLKTENLDVDEAEGRILPDGRAGRFVRLTVSDTGTGMDKETQQHVFEPFFTTKEVGKGTGLGLSVVYGVIKQHGGWVNVYSELGVGSTFKIYLPAGSGNDRPEEPVKGPSLDSVRGRGERVLLIEDEKRLNQFIRRALTENGYDVMAAENADQAIRLFERENGRFDLVLSDVVLPGKDGLELLNDLLSRKPDLKVLLSSGYTDHKNQWPVIRKKGYRFLPKPYSLIELLSSIRGALSEMTALEGK
jgi:PAS domain S-box-containing protein